MRSALLFSAFIIFIGLGSLFTTPGCANIIPPSGGLRDSLPPILLEAEPADSSVNFRGNVIRLHFDEYIDLQNVPQNLIFTPTFQTNPQVEVKLKTITIKLRDSLEANTTYTFNFGDAIRDINEGNILRNYDYTFSTGPALDSLELRGKVILAETGRIDSTLTVILHRDLSDSAVVKERPRYVAKLDRNGNFVFKNLPAGSFAAYALGEAGLARRYLSKTQLFAFADSPVVVQPSNPDITLYAYRAVSAAPAVPQIGSIGGRTGNTGNDKRLRISTNLTGTQHDLLKDFELRFEQPLTMIDTNLIRLAADSSFNPVTYSTTIDSARRKITIKTNWQESTSYHFILNKDFAEDSLGRRLLRNDTISFTTKSRADYGRVSIRVRNINVADNPVLQFVQNGTVVFSAPVKSGTFNSSLFVPGDYELRVLFDRNNNGIWDPGEFFNEKRQPEIVRSIERRINVKPAYDNEFEVSL